MEPEKYRKTLNLCHKIFNCTLENLMDVINNFIEMAELLYPKGYNSGTVELLKYTLSDPIILNGYIPAAKNEVNIMTLHKSKGLEFNIVFHMDMYKYIISDERCTNSEIEKLMNLNYVSSIMNGTQRYRSRQQDLYPAYPSSFLMKEGLQKRREELIW